MILKGIELIIASLIEKELVVSSLLKDPAVREHDYFIGMLNG